MALVIAILLAVFLLPSLCGVVFVAGAVVFRLTPIVPRAREVTPP